MVYVSGDPKGTLTYNSFLRGVRDEEGSRVHRRCAPGTGWTGAACGPTCDSRNTQPSELRFRALLSKGVPEVELGLV
ncbi:MAG: hypothetical protein M3N09_05900 [Actinomycetota bacterium]|nr:hypothetical protein [Actinomycetota bacterium]